LYFTKVFGYFGEEEEIQYFGYFLTGDFGGFESLKNKKMKVKTLFLLLINWGSNKNSHK